VGPRAGLDDPEKRKFLTLPGLELRPLSHLARSMWLYRLLYLFSASTKTVLFCAVVIWPLKLLQANYKFMKLLSMH
jgi:hypothetical protein